MDEAEWLTSTDPLKMYGHLRSAGLIQGNRSRKYRLYNVACCRRLWPLLTDERSRRAVEVVERYVDGLATEDDEARASGDAADAATSLAEAARAKYGSTGAADAPMTAIRHAADAAVELAGGSPHVDEYAIPAAVVRASGTAPYRPGRFKGLEEEEKRRLSDFYRDIFGNPFRPVAVDPAWLSWKDRTIPKLARAVYDERAFDRLPVLADALEEAGCTDAGLLGHLRGPGPHTRGCWGLDALLGLG